MLRRFHVGLIPERYGRTDGRADGQNCYINNPRQCANARSAIKIYGTYVHNVIWWSRLNDQSPQAGARDNWPRKPANQTATLRPRGPGSQATHGGGQDGCCLRFWLHVLALSVNRTVACVGRNGLDGDAVGRCCISHLCQHAAGPVCIR